jgi:hypothetical protein
MLKGWEEEAPPDGQGGWPVGTKLLNFDAPPISKSHGEDQKETWKEEKVESNFKKKQIILQD